jgi:alpha-mannosidase
MMQFSPERDIVSKQIENRLSEIKDAILYDVTPIEGWKTVVSGQGLGVEPAPESGWTPYEIGTPWGGPDTCQWFRASVQVPSCIPDDKVVLGLRPGGEALCIIDGVPIQGLDSNRHLVHLLDKSVAGKTVEVTIDANSSATISFDTAYIAVQDTDTHNLYYDLLVAFDVSRAHDQDKSSIGSGLLEMVYDVIMRVDLGAVANRHEWRKQVVAASKVFHKRIKDYKHSYNEGAFTVMGQSHLDTAWLWPLRTTHKKCGRTFSTALHYMDQYPDFTFMMSQPQIYEYVKQWYPTIWERLKEKIANGQWEVSGAPWVEQDLNVPSGEAHVRQYLYGNRYLREEFGVHSRVVWMPDCFGYTFSLPQIMKKAQIDYFFTTKLHGNQYNRHPYDLFRWRGIDGSEVVAIQAPNACNDRPTPDRLKQAWVEFRQKNAAPEMPYAFGHGDGGGGPTIEQIEYARRLGNTSGVPRLTWGKVEETYERISNDIDADDLPVFHDEMYYEKHRGCQTTHARTKRNNRMSELLARDTEFLSSMAYLRGDTYDHERINDAWKLILLNQFHDILPGSSISEVYVDADRDYAIAQDGLNAARISATESLLISLDTSGDGKAIVVHNTLGWDRSDVAILDIEVPSDTVSVVDGNGEVVRSQRSTAPDGSAILLFEADEVPSLGHAVYHIIEGEHTPKKTGSRSPRVSKTRIENDFFDIRIGRDGTISRIWDKSADREVLADGQRGNTLSLFEDRPANSDAWDIDFNAFHMSEEISDIVSMEVVEDGPVRATLRVVKATEKSTITQDISVWRTLNRIDFATQVQWHEKHKLLKAAFPVDVTSRRATYEIQYGAIERPTHRSTQWDAARFEVPAHRWIDLSESDYGVSILNDCKYGFDVEDNVMRISLLRSPTAPDPHADEGYQEFTYSLYPHTGSWQEAQTVHRAYEANVPLTVNVTDAHGGAVPSLFSFATVDNPNVILDCVKKAEDSDDIIVRLYEAYGTRGQVNLGFTSTPAHVVECDLMEENDESVELDGNGIEFVIKPWEIRTFKVRF